MLERPLKVANTELEFAHVLADCRSIELVAEGDHHRECLRVRMPRLIDTAVMHGEPGGDVEGPRVSTRASQIVIVVELQRAIANSFGLFKAPRLEQTRGNLIEAPNLSEDVAAGFVELERALCRLDFMRPERQPGSHAPHV